MRDLKLIEPKLQNYVSAILDAIDQGAVTVRISPSNERARSVVKILINQGIADESIQVLDEFPLPLISNVDRTDDCVFVLIPDQHDQLDALLETFLDLENGWLVAPRTERYFASNPLFLISIPKAGTHLLYGLVRQMGYQDGIELIDFPEPGYWYNLEYSNSHTAAPDYFIDTVRRSPFGNRAHPFPRTPTLMIYRNPLDILVSEANYYDKDGNTSFSGYFSGLTFEQKVSRLINDTWLFGSIRDRVGKFIPWIEFPNIIPLSFEELAGARGGGDDTIRDRLIWSLQLKLQVSGTAEEIGDQIFNPDSPTFFKGQIGQYRKVFSQGILDQFNLLKQDFMKIYGYNGSNLKSAPFPPLNAETFRKRWLRLSKEDPDEIPLIFDVFMECNLVRYRQNFYAIPCRLGEIRLEMLDNQQLEALPSATRIKELKNILLLGDHIYAKNRNRAITSSAAAIQRDVDACVVDNFLDFNIVSARGRLYGVDKSIGAVDFNESEDFLLSKYSELQLIPGVTVNEIQARILNIQIEKIKHDLICQVTDDTQTLSESIQRFEEMRTRIEEYKREVDCCFHNITARIDRLENKLDSLMHTQVTGETEKCRDESIF